MDYGEMIEALVAARKAGGHSMEQVGRKLGVARQTINGWEKRHYKPTGEDLIRWADAVGLRIDARSAKEIAPSAVAVAADILSPDDRRTILSLIRVLTHAEGRMKRVAAGYIRSLEEELAPDVEEPDAEAAAG